MSERGFTLVELVVALFVFALLATAGTALLSVSIKSQQAVTASLSKGAESGRIVSLLSTDLAQAASRPVRNRDGAVQPAFVGRDGGRDGVFLAYVRNDNAGVQRVEWRREGRKLIRASATALDGGATVRTSVMAQDIGQLHMRYRYKGEWRPDWSPTRLDALPHAVEIELAQGRAPPLRASFLAGVGLP
jgi:general secretion pathway protein J